MTTHKQFEKNFKQRDFVVTLEALKYPGLNMTWYSKVYRFGIKQQGGTNGNATNILKEKKLFKVH